MGQFQWMARKALHLFTIGASATIFISLIGIPQGTVSCQATAQRAAATDTIIIYWPLNSHPSECNSLPQYAVINTAKHQATQLQPLLEAYLPPVSGPTGHHSGEDERVQCGCND